MKKTLNTILDKFSQRLASARVNTSPDFIEKELSSIDQLSSNEKISALAELYFNQNPNVYAPGNNARLYAGPEPEALMGAFIALLGNNSGGTFKSNPVGTIMAERAFEYLTRDVIGYEHSESIDTSGGMAANAMAIHVARQKFKPNAKEHGNEDIKFVLLTSDQSHYSQDGAVNRAGLGIDNIEFISTNADGSMNLEELEKALQHYPAMGYCTVVASTFGTTVLGAFDDIDKTSDLCDKYNADWHHVDASWGGPAAVSKYAKNFGDLSRVDSVTLDVHKAFKSTLTCGVFITKHIGLLYEANSSRNAAKYLYHYDSKNLDNGIRSLECGKTDRVFPFGTLLLFRGVAGLSDMINRDFARAEYFSNCINESSEFILMHDPRYLNICVQLYSPFENIPHSEFTQKVSNYLLNTESSFSMTELCKETKSNGYVFRFILSNSNMDNIAIDNILEEVIEAKGIIEEKILNECKQVS